jgi:hypothetical protein
LGQSQHGDHYRDRQDEHHGRKRQQEPGTKTEIESVQIRCLFPKMSGTLVSLRRCTYVSLQDAIRQAACSIGRAGATVESRPENCERIALCRAHLKSPPRNSRAGEPLRHHPTLPLGTGITQPNLPTCRHRTRWALRSPCSCR